MCSWLVLCVVCFIIAYILPDWLTYLEATLCSIAFTIFFLLMNVERSTTKHEVDQDLADGQPLYVIRGHSDTRLDIFGYNVYQDPKAGMYKDFHVAKSYGYLKAFTIGNGITINRPDSAKEKFELAQKYLESAPNSPFLNYGMHYFWVVISYLGLQFVLSFFWIVAELFYEEYFHCRDYTFRPTSLKFIFYQMHNPACFALNSAIYKLKVFAFQKSLDMLEIAMKSVAILQAVSHIIIPQTQGILKVIKDSLFP